MRLVRIEPAEATVRELDGDPDELIEELLEKPVGLVMISPERGLLCCAVGTIGPNRHLWWHKGLEDVFGGTGLIVGLRGEHEYAPLREGEVHMIWQSIEFLGKGAKAMPRVSQLVGSLIPTEDDTLPTRRKNDHLH